MTLSNQNIYAYNALNANMVHLNDSESFLCASLMHLGHRLKLEVCNVEDFAKELMAVINSTSAFYQLDRVCLSMVYKGANCLQAISTHNSSRVGENIMKPGYFCFTSSKSSLLSTRRTNCRSFGNIDFIVGAYQNKPVQRSLSYLKEMGLKSGLAIPLGDFGPVRGLLFLNTANSGDFSYSQESDYFIISLIGLIAENFMRSYMDRFSLPTRSELDYLFSPKAEQFINPDRVETNVNSLLVQSLYKQLKLELDVLDVPSEVFMDNGILAYTLYRVLLLNKKISNFSLYKVTMQYEVQHGKSFLNLMLPDFFNEKIQIEELDALKIMPGLTFDQANTTLKIQIEVDVAKNGIDYSF